MNETRTKTKMMLLASKAIIPERDTAKNPILEFIDLASISVVSRLSTILTLLLAAPKFVA